MPFLSFYVPLKQPLCKDIFFSSENCASYKIVVSPLFVNLFTTFVFASARGNPDDALLLFKMH